jgi:histidyl-tRNA synthetase
MIIKAPKGTKDILPNDVYRWQYIEQTIREVCGVYGYKEIRTPAFEYTELFERGVGSTTDVVQKEMYTFNDKGGRSITLRPEVTAPVVRSYLENSLYAQPQPTKMFYIVPCFRHENPQKGRLRQFHQFGTEVFGAGNPETDAEIISLASALLKRLGIKGLKLKINSIGCPNCRQEYSKKLQEYFKDYLDDLCGTCLGRLDKNPLRILDCKIDSHKDFVESAPVLADYLCSECFEHFEELKNILDSIGINYIIDHTIVRGLDYYTKTVFEIVSVDIGAQGTVCGGGRYDGLVEQLGGSSTCGIGFGLGIERLLMVMEAQNIEIPQPNTLQLFIATIGDKANVEAQKIIHNLREKGISCDKDQIGRSLRAQMKYSDKINAKFSVVLGEDEINTCLVSLKNMENGEAFEINIESLAEVLKTKL